MDNYVYNAVSKYFNTLGVRGYMNQKDVNSLLVLLFYYNLIYHDYRGYISREDYGAIERALNCLYGSNCLIPYPDYLKMGKLKLGEMTEILSRTKAVEDLYDALDKRVGSNAEQLESQGETLEDHENRIGDIEDTMIIQSDNDKPVKSIDDIPISVLSQIPLPGTA